ncbi:MAG: D-arabinose 5-phosphate isomerase [Bdellovibrionales bacterium RBG_16_40_8]|nr:MAG: D-arabinose 5-phosphate isomerase [Bdellovibrionales bacterium RBG_16_40_8]
MEIEEARRVLRVEAQSILDTAERLDQNFKIAVDKIIACKGKLIITGIGKSGLIGRKISSTFSSTGTPSLFLHPAESSHGDLGVISNSDIVLAISNSGETEELVPILNFVVRRNIPLLVMTSKASSLMGKAGIFIDISVKEEACSLGLAPTSSSAVTLALGDALAMAVLKVRGFGRDAFAEFHPAGSLGRRLFLRVRDLMHSGVALPVVKKKDNMAKALALMTSAEVRGVAGVVDDTNQLCGCITDGDLRRRLEKKKNPLDDLVEDIMSLNPKTIDVSEMAEKALFVMEQFQIQNLFITDKQSTTPQAVVGIIHLQDLLKAKLR